MGGCAAHQLGLLVIGLHAPAAFVAAAFVAAAFVAAAAGCLLTGREILQQTHGRLHAFVSGAGTGGTIAGVSQALKEHNPDIRVVLADPQGSSLFNKASACCAGITATHD